MRLVYDNIIIVYRIGVGTNLNKINRRTFITIIRLPIRLDEKQTNYAWSTLLINHFQFILLNKFRYSN